ncbi:MAG: type 4a pilus biogenesis protein PilO [Acidobacteriales bacterium]|nr:type 4a pilus biogenesis protein PilO [Terriglobales bacterium]
MAGLKELPVPMQLLVALLIAVVLGGAAWYALVKPVEDQNVQKRAQLAAKKADNENLRRYERDLPALERQIASLMQQLEIQKTIVPDEKEADQFIHLMQDTAASAGIFIRRYTAKPIAAREFYTEVPFEMDIDGPYYAVLNFFEKVARLQRIINIGSLQMATPKRSSDAKVKNTYTYSPTESVVASCTAITFFSHDSNKMAAPAPPAAAGAPARR